MVDTHSWVMAGKWDLLLFWVFLKVKGLPYYPDLCKLECLDFQGKLVTLGIHLFPSMSQLTR